MRTSEKARPREKARPSATGREGARAVTVGDLDRDLDRGIGGSSIEKPRDQKQVRPRERSLSLEAEGNGHLVQGSPRKCLRRRRQKWGVREGTSVAASETRSVAEAVRRRARSRRLGRRAGGPTPERPSDASSRASVPQTPSTRMYHPGRRQIRCWLIEPRESKQISSEDPGALASRARDRSSCSRFPLRPALSRPRAP